MTILSRPTSSEAAVPLRALPGGDPDPGPGQPARKAVSSSVPLQVTERDTEIVRAVDRYRYLKTSQVRRLLFPESTTLQSARRRLRKLAHPGWRYLGRITPSGQIGEENAESAFYLDKAGFDLLVSMGEEPTPFPRSRPGHSTGHAFLAHSLLISDFRISLELAIKSVPRLSLGRFVHDAELKTHLRRSLKKDAYKLYNLLPHPRGQKDYVVHPDALFVLAAPGKETVHQRLLFLEIDRGTESLRHLRDKTIGYHLLRAGNVYRKFGEFSGFRVLLATTSARRAQHIRQALVGLEGEDLVWTAALPAVSETTVLNGPIWLDHEGNERSILRR